MAYIFTTLNATCALVFTDGSQQAVSLPSTVSILPGKRLRAAVFERAAIICNATSRPVFLSEDYTLRELSIPTPFVPGVATGAAGNLTGDYSIRVQFLVKDDKGNVIASSELSPASADVTLSSQLLAHTLPTSPLSAVNARRIYRTVAGGSEYFWDFDVDDNTTTSISMGNADATLSTEAVDEGDYAIAPSIDLVTAWKGRAWGRAKTAPDTLFGTADGNITSWPIQIPIPPPAADERGITGFLARKDELGVLKQNCIHKIIGDNEDNFARRTLAEGVGSVAEDACLVIDDIGYFRSGDGVCVWDSTGVRSITDDKVRPWFTTDTYFNRSRAQYEFAAYDPRTHSYLLFLHSAGSSSIDRWVQYDIANGNWYGPHKTASFTPFCAAQVLDANGLPMLAIGGTDGYLYYFVDANFNDGTGSSTAIDFDVIGKWHAGNPPAPAITHGWHGPDVFTKPQASGTLTVTPTVGTLESSAGTAQNVDLTNDRTRLTHFGPGRLCQLRFRQNTAGVGCELYGYDLPYIDLGRR